MRLLFWTMFAVLSAATLVISVPAAAEPPTAPLNFCNRTSEEVDVAVGYYSSGIHDEQSSNVLTGPFVTRGWWGVSGGQCQSFANPFDARYMFWFPIQRTARTHIPVDDTANPARHMCISGASFTFEDQNVSIDTCHADPAATTSAGVRWVVGHKVDTEVDPNVSFTGYDY